MHSVLLEPAEFWFYRVFSELTLSLLHQVNNELTGVSFLSELIRDDVAEGHSPEEKFVDLRASVEKIIRLTQQTIDCHLPISSEDADISFHPEELLERELPTLRLVLPKSISIRIDPVPGERPAICIQEKEFRILLAGIGVLLTPQQARAQGELVVQWEPNAPALTFFPKYEVAGCANGDSLPGEFAPGFVALSHRAKRVGGQLEPATSSDPGLRLIFQPASP